jgi:predicted nucleic acid-binding protein
MKLLETSYLVDYEQGVESAREYYHEHGHVSLVASTISTFELAFGVAWSSSSSLEELVASLSWVEFLPFTVEDALEGARIQAEMQAAGTRLPVADSMIAGVARNRGAVLVAADPHFDDIDGLSVEHYRA